MLPRTTASHPFCSLPFLAPTATRNRNPGWPGSCVIVLPPSKALTQDALGQSAAAASLESLMRVRQQLLGTAEHGMRVQPGTRKRAAQGNSDTQHAIIRCAAAALSRARACYTAAQMQTMPPMDMCYTSSTSSSAAPPPPAPPAAPPPPNRRRRSASFLARSTFWAGTISARVTWWVLPAGQSVPPREACEQREPWKHGGVARAQKHTQQCYGSTSCGMPAQLQPIMSLGCNMLRQQIQPQHRQTMQRAPAMMMMAR